jgi:HK97 family phage major capsid protein
MSDDLKTALDETKKFAEVQAKFKEEVKKSVYDELIPVIDELKKSHKEMIEAMEKRNALEASQKSLSDKSGQPKNAWQEVIKCLNDPTYYEKDDVKKTIMTTNVGSQLGYFIPTREMDEFKTYLMQNSFVRTNSNVIPSDPKSPDAKLIFNKIGQAADGTLSKPTFEYVGEAHALTETDINAGQLQLEPKDCGLIIYVSNKSMRNIPAVETYLKNSINTSAADIENEKFMSGTGGLQPTGIVTSKAMQMVSRNTTGQIKREDIIAMKQYMLGREESRYKWLISKTSYEAIVELKDATGYKLLYDDATKTLAGIPVIWTPEASVYGAKNDLMLMNFDWYSILDGQKLLIELSTQYRFNQNQTAIKATMSHDGDTWLDRPIVQKDTSVVTPFIGLAA